MTFLLFRAKHYSAIESSRSSDEPPLLKPHRFKDIRLLSYKKLSSC